MTHHSLCPRNGSMKKCQCALIRMVIDTEKITDRYARKVAYEAGITKGRADMQDTVLRALGFVSARRTDT